MTYILGISCFYHDSAATLVRDGKIIAAAQEERFTRIKHDESFPTKAIDYCLMHAGITIADIDYVGFYDKPLKKFERLVETYISFSPVGFSSFYKALPLWIKEKLHTQKMLKNGLGKEFNKSIIYSEHHESHAASAFYPSPFHEAAILVIDGVGEWATTSIGYGCGQKLDMLEEIRFPHSIGLLYSAFTHYLGFKVNSGEYKVMGLAPYGQPTYKDRILDSIVHIKDDGSFWLDMSYFSYCQGLTMTSEKFHSFFGHPPRISESKLTTFHFDVAASVQAVTEELVAGIGRYAKKITGASNLVMAGGVALNCVANGKLLKSSIFDDIWVQPAAGDAGGSLGVAMLIWYKLLENPRSVNRDDSQFGSYLGPSFTNEEVRSVLNKEQIHYHQLKSSEETVERTASFLNDGCVVGWFQGRMEFGPRALGARSILGDPRRSEMQKKVNLKIKFRESFRPFAPSVLKDRASCFFDFPDDKESPYMLMVSPVRNKIDSLENREAKGLDRLALRLSDLPAITHVDCSSRLQTVTKDRNGRYHQLLSEFDRLTGCPVLINTSFNVRGEPIVCSVQDAINCFFSTDMDVLVIEDNILIKDEQTKHNFDRAEYLKQFSLD